MEENKKCMCGCSDERVVACSGASNAGQIAKKVVSIDGCPAQCAARTLQHVEIEPDKVKEEMGYRPPGPTSCLNRGDKVYDYTE
jgi:uncharacterized metal-binding protein